MSKKFRKNKLASVSHKCEKCINGIAKYVIADKRLVAICQTCFEIKFNDKIQTREDKDNKKHLDSISVDRNPEIIAGLRKFALDKLNNSGYSVSVDDKNRCQEATHVTDCD